MIVIINSCYQFVQINTELNKQYSTIINMDDLSEKFRTVDRRFMVTKRIPKCSTLINSNFRSYEMKPPVIYSRK